MDKIAIIGTGLIGASIGLALRQQKRTNLQVDGFDAEVDVGKKAQKRGAVDKAVWQLTDAVKDARIVVIATPVLAIRDVLETIAGMVAPGTVVMDTGGTKDAVMQWAEEYLPSGVSFVGGDPLTGKGMSGVDNATPDLFAGRRYALIPGRSATEEAVQAAVALVESISAKPFFVDSFEHDSYVAAVSHLPVLLSEALVSTTSRSPAWNEMGGMASAGYETASSLAAADPIVNLDMCMTNQQGIVHWINEAIRQLQELRELVRGAGDEDGAEALGNELARNWQEREVWHTKYVSGDFDSDSKQRPQYMSMGDTMLEFMMGGRLRERYQQLFNLQSKRGDERRRRRFRRS